MPMRLHGGIVLHLSLSIVLAALAGAVTESSWSQVYPTRPIRMVVAQPAGGTMDAFARAVSEYLERQLGQNIVVDNRGGANGIIAGDTVAKAAPDGYTLLYTTNSTINNQIVQKKIPFDVMRDFAPITELASLPGYLVLANPQVPAQSIKELIALSKSSRGPVNFGSGGFGNSQHLAGELLNARSGAKLMHVPYKGFAQMIIGLVGNEVQVGFAAPPTVIQHIKSGRLRVLAYTGAKRWQVMPEVPTVAESGVPGFVFEAAWHGMFAPAATPAAIVARIQGEVVKAIQTPKLRDYLESGGYVVVGSTPAEFRKFVAADLKNIAEIVRVANIKPE